MTCPNVSHFISVKFLPTQLLIETSSPSSFPTCDKHSAKTISKSTKNCFVVLHGIFFLRATQQFVGQIHSNCFVLLFSVCAACPKLGFTSSMWLTTVQLEFEWNVRCKRWLIDVLLYSMTVLIRGFGSAFFLSAFFFFKKNLFFLPLLPHCLYPRSPLFPCFYSVEWLHPNHFFSSTAFIIHVLLLLPPCAATSSPTDPKTPFAFALLFAIGQSQVVPRPRSTENPLCEPKSLLSCSWAAADQNFSCECWELCDEKSYLPPAESPDGRLKAATNCWEAERAVLTSDDTFPSLSRPWCTTHCLMSAFSDHQNQKAGMKKWIF